MRYVRMPIEIESPEQMGYGNVRYNLTESSVSDRFLGNINLSLSETLLCYGDHKGIPGLRELLASTCGLSEKDVLVTAGAAAALFIVSSSLLQTGDHLLAMFPNYATNIETPRAMGCSTGFIQLDFENGFRPDFEQIGRMITPNTRLISITTPHNPTGMCLTESELMQFIQLAEKNNLWLLVDETYRELSFGPKTPLAATLSEKAISISSVSKAYGLPGLRIGWIICRNPALQELFLAAKEQMYVCNSVLDETAAFEFLKSGDVILQETRKKNEAHFTMVRSFMENENRLEWVVPQGGVVCFPRLKSVDSDAEKFHRVLNGTFKTYVGPGHWFEMDKRYFRIGYGWPTTADLKTGLENISRSLDAL